ncbi:filamentous hemagglutinin family N-terminal domain containing protein [Caulobacter sp. AP07]|uniref:beta strand repeat-containing protein n=1 Tax=Caulobacter sp. AP07 TaxID=1144304 RepID=UPI000271EE65|nr:filamentous hemagglutinin N-terminal domain-containing protein [Caulobacter sp. AP07]EJL23354.1 filamentous hemagglutinin family N-terminal domain containing protein [Caulobacter sp. AP07]
MTIGLGSRAPAGGRGRIARFPLFGLSLLPWLMAVSPAMAQAPALPTGATLQAGSATISAPSDSALTVNQSSGRAVIDWTSFSIGEGGKVDFQNGSGATLNRVTGGERSSIDGLLSATGSVYLLNPSGVIIGKSGVVDVGGGFVASTLDVPNDAFMGGGALSLAGASGASVVNLGKIGALGGDVVLAAYTVSNAGTVSAPGGDVGLLAGRGVRLRDQALHDGKFAVDIVSPGASVTNGGDLRAAMVELKANGGNVYALAGNTGGAISATGVSSRDGKVFLIAEGGALTARGDITARGAGGGPGFVETSGAAVDFSGVRIDTGGGDWLVDPYNLTVDAAAAATISANLASTNVTLQTTASGATGPGVVAPGGQGDITVDAGISWSSANRLTLDAYHGIAVNAPIVASGAGKVTLTTNNGGTGGKLAFAISPTLGFTGGLSFTGAANSGQDLVINGQAYTLIYSTADLLNVNNSPNGRYALARTIDVASLYATNKNRIIYTFGGSFNGLGNSLSNLKLENYDFNQPNFGFDKVGLFQEIMFGGSVTGLGLTNAAISVTFYGPHGDSVYGGTLVGRNGGALTGNFVSGAVATTSFYGSVGGLAGYNTGDVKDNVAAVSVSNDQSSNTFAGALGGLIGESIGTVANSLATGAVTGWGNWTGGVGGLVGVNQGAITGGKATGAVSNNVVQTGDGMTAVAGGLVGVSSGVINGGSTASGAVTGGKFVGGLVGSNFGILDTVSASGAVTGLAYVGGLAGYSWPQTINAATSSGTVTGQNSSTYVGGLIGLNVSTITNSSSSSAVIVGTSSSHTGGLVGFNAGTLSNDTATGGVVAGASSTFTGGLVGSNIGTVTASTALGSVSGQSYVGGLVGQNVATSYGSPLVPAGAYPGTINGGSLASGAVTGIKAVGGLVGYSSGVINTASAGGGAVSGADQVGGLVGFNGGSIANTHTTQANVTASLSSVGGLVGANGGTISDSSSANIVNGAAFSSNIGGLVGGNYGGALINVQSTSTVIAGVLSAYTGGLIGYNNGALNGGSATGSVNGFNYVGGLMGYNSGALTGSSATGAVTGATGVGGLVGYNAGLLTSVSAGTGQVSGTTQVGGLVGYNAVAGTINGGVTGSALIAASLSSVGGLVGLNGGFVTGSSSSNVVGIRAAVDNVGGLVGFNAGTLSNNRASGAVSSGGANSGGLVGLNYGAVSSSTAIGAVTGASYVGGLIGYNSAAVSGSNATGAVSGSTGVGGLVGYNGAALTNVAAGGGQVSGDSQIGGLVGFNASAGSVNGAYAVAGGSNLYVIALGSAAGGLVGINGGLVQNAYTDLGASADGGIVGGIVGLNVGTIQNAWVNGGGFSPAYGSSGFVAGYNAAGATLSNLYYSRRYVGSNLAVGPGGAGTITNVTAVGPGTGNDAYAQATYVGFNFATVWAINAGASRPYLQALFPGTPPN